MNYTPEDELLIKKYLLREISAQQLQQVEARLMTDTAYFEQINLVEDDLIDDYVQGKLLAEERKSFEAAYLSSSAGQEQVNFIKALRQYALTQTPVIAKSQTQETAKPKWWKRFFSNPVFTYATAFLILFILGSAAWRIFIYQPKQSNIDKGLIALKKAYEGTRPFEARISGFNYAPFDITRGDDKEKLNKLSLTLAESLLLQEPEKSTDAEAFYGIGKYYLLKKDFDEAINNLEKAANLSPNLAPIQADLGVAYLEAGRKSRAADDNKKAAAEFTNSLEHLTKTLKINDTFLEARFNRALLFEEWRMYHEAEDEWRKYLQQDEGSPWANEAREKLQQLENRKKTNSQNLEQALDSFLAAYHSRDAQKAWQIISVNRSRYGNAFVEKLTDDYLEAISQKRFTDSEKQLQLLTFASRVEARQVGDNYTSQMVAFYKQSSLSQIEKAVQARGLLKEALNNFSSSNNEAAVADYAKAENLFRLARDEAEADFAKFWQGLCYLRIPASQKSLQLFNSLSPAFEKKNFKSLLAQNYQAMGDAYSTLAEPSKVLEFADKSMSLAKAIDDKETALRSYQLYVNNAVELNDYDEALGYALQAVETVGEYMASPKVIWPFYQQAARALLLENHSAEAVPFQEEALSVALESEWSPIIVRSYSQFGTIIEATKNRQEAVALLEKALTESQTISSEKGRWNSEGFANLHLGQIYRQSRDYEKALAYYNRAIELYEKLDNPQIYLYKLHKGKLLSQHALNDTDAIKTELPLTINLFEKYRAKILEESRRNLFFDKDQDIYDIAVDFEYSTMNDVETAFEYAEKSKARSLLDLLNSAASSFGEKNLPEYKALTEAQPLSLKEIYQQQPAQTQILQFAVLPQKTIIWLVSEKQLQYKETAIDAPLLQEKIQAYIHRIAQKDENDSEDVKKEAADLYQILIAPIEESLDKTKELCIIPDKSLNFLPFSSLYCQGSGKFLFEDFPLLISPSASVFINCSNAAKNKATNTFETLLSFGNPRFDAKRFPELRDLTTAEDEAKQIAQNYPSSAVYLGKEANESVFRKEALRADVIHFAGHFVADKGSAMLSKIILAKEPESSNKPADSDGCLQAFEVYKMKFPATKLVVLSACQTGLELSYHGEGAIGISRPFLAAGVPLVVASLWPIDSKATYELMIRFHKYRRDSGSSVKALKRAQLEMLQSSQPKYHHPYYWAAFNLVGGYAEF
jgi:CHAT domain-containing protein